MLRFKSIFLLLIKVIAEAKEDRQNTTKIAKNGLLCVTFMSVKELSNVSNYFESSIQLANIFQLKSLCDWAVLVCTGIFFHFKFSTFLFSALTMKSVLRCRISCSHRSFLQSSHCRAVCGSVPSIVGAHHFQNTYGPS